jgi:hypothetical protein
MRSSSCVPWAVRASHPDLPTQRRRGRPVEDGARLVNRHRESDSKPLPQANDGEMFFYRESVDVDYSMERFSDRVECRPA